MTHIREWGVTVIGLENSLTWCKRYESWICCFGLHSCCSILPNALTAQSNPICIHILPTTAHQEIGAKSSSLPKSFNHHVCQFSPLKHCEAGEADRVLTAAPSLTGFKTRLSSSLWALPLFTVQSTCRVWKYSTWNTRYWEPSVVGNVPKIYLAFISIMLTCLTVQRQCCRRWQSKFFSHTCELELHYLLWCCQLAFMPIITRLFSEWKHWHRFMLWIHCIIY